MATIKLKSLITEAEDFQARSKETGKLVHFKSKDAYQAALKAGTHQDPKAKKSGQSKADAKPNDMFGGDYAKDRGGEAPKVDAMATVNSIAAKTGLRAQAVAGWADENGVNLSKVSADIDSKKLKPMDFMTAVSGNPGNKYAKDIIAKYSQGGGEAPKGKEVSNNDIEGLTSYKDFTKFYKANSDKLNKDYVSDIEGQIEALEYLESDYENGDADREEVLVAYEELQDLIKKSMKSSSSPKADPTTSVDGQTDDELYDAMYDMGYDFGELGSDDFDEDGFADAAMSLGYRWDDKNKVWINRDDVKESSTKLTSMIKK